MANRNQLMSIPLNGQLCLNKTKVDIEQFNGFNKINAPIYGGCLSPLYKKEVTPKGDYWDTDGNYYQAKADGLYKNGELVMEYSATEIHFEEVEKEAGEEILYVRGESRISLLKINGIDKIRYRVNSEKYFDETFYDTGNNNFYIDSLGRFYFIENLNSEEWRLNVLVYKNNHGLDEFNTVRQKFNKYEEGDLTEPVLQVYVYDTYSFITVYTRSFENISLGAGLDSSGLYNNKYFLFTYVFDGEFFNTVTFNVNNTGSSYAQNGILPNAFTKYGIIAVGKKNITTSSNYARVEMFPRWYISDYNASTHVVTCNINIGQTQQLYLQFYPNTANFIDVSLTINKNFFRILYTYKGEAGKNKTVLLDTRFELFLGCGSESSESYINNSPAYSKGLIFNVLYNNNLPSNISHGNKILADWFSIDSEFVITDYFKTSKGKIYKAINEAVTPEIISIINNRFIITNTENNYCYDIQEEKSVFPFSDYNGYLVPFRKYYDGQSNNTGYKNMIVGASINPKYELTNDTVCSAIFPARIYYDIDLHNISVAENVDLFASEITENSVALYYASRGESALASYLFTKPELVGSSYPVSTNGSMQLNMNANSKYVQTYNNHDFVINGSTSYALNYYNGEVVLLYSMLSAIENLQNVFVLNTSAYGISKDKIFAMYYSDGVSTLGEVVANIKGLQYVGALPTRAIFYNPLDRCLYCFTGDAILSKYIECSDVSAVYNSWYNASSQTILFSSNAGLYVMSNDFIYNLDFRPENIFFLDGGKFVMNLNNDSEKSIFFAYEKLDSGYTTLNIQLETKYYGEGRNLPGVVDCWYIRFFNNGIKEGGTIKVRASALTDTGKVGEEKEIALLPSSWDKETDSYYLRFQPHLQKGIGVCLELDSPFAILDITCGYSGFDGAAQISHNNL